MIYQHSTASAGPPTRTHTCQPHQLPHNSCRTPHSSAELWPPTSSTCGHRRGNTSRNRLDRDMPSLTEGPSHPEALYAFTTRCRILGSDALMVKLNNQASGPRIGYSDRQINIRQINKSELAPVPASAASAPPAHPATGGACGARASSAAAAVLEEVARGGGSSSAAGSAAANLDSAPPPARMAARSAAAKRCM